MIAGHADRVEFMGDSLFRSAASLTDPVDRSAPDAASTRSGGTQPLPTQQLDVAADVLG